MARERFSLKDHLFNADKIAYLGGLIEAGVEGFDRDSFEGSVMARLPDLELKQRIALIAEILADHLDPDFEVATDQIRSVLPPPLDPTLTDDDFGDFIFAPFGKFVEDRGADHLETSLDTLRDLTKRFSMEGSIRPFIDRRPDDVLACFETWARDPNYHVRRLVSESTRPLLPWSPRLDLDVAAPLPLLDILHADRTRYVTRSVANHLNDISKIEPRLVFDALNRWRDEEMQSADELAWMTNHALRTLVKKGDQEAMRMLGYSPDPAVEVGPIELANAVVEAGDALQFSFSIISLERERLMVDYVIEFVRKNGTTSPRVFKLKKLTLEAGQSTRLVKTHPLRADATTYSLSSGTHRISVMVNGKAVTGTEFEVRTG